MTEKGQEIELANPLDELILVSKYMTWVNRLIRKFRI